MVDISIAPTCPSSAAARRRGNLAFRLDEASVDRCLAHLETLAALWYRSLAQYRVDVLGLLSLLLSELGRAAAPVEGQDATGLPPKAYLAQVRAERAAVLLLHSDDPVTAIGRAVGWPDQNYFARRFKAHYGLSATTYRKRFAAWAAAHPHGAL